MWPRNIATISGKRPLFLSEVGDGHAVIGQHGGDRAGEGVGFHLAGAVTELDDGERRSAVDGEEHGKSVLGEAHLTAVDVHVADRGLGKAPASGRLPLVCRQPRDAMPLQVSFGMASRRNPTTSSSGRRQRQRDDERLLGWREEGAARFTRRHGAIWRRFRVHPVSGGEGAGARLRRLERGSNTRRCWGSREEPLPWCNRSIAGQGCTITLRDEAPRSNAGRGGDRPRRAYRSGRRDRAPRARSPIGPSPAGRGPAATAPRCSPAPAPARHGRR